MLRVEEPREGISDPESLHRGSDSQQDGNKTLNEQMLSTKCRVQSECSSSEEGAGLKKGGREKASRERTEDEVGKIRLGSIEKAFG